MKADIKFKINNPATLNGEPVKIPLNGYNFYRNIASKQLPWAWVDGDINTSPPDINGNFFPASENKAWYEFKGMKDVVINKIRIYDAFGNLPSPYLKIYAVDEYYQPVFLCEFTGASYMLWKEYTFPPVKAVYLLFIGPGIGVGGTSTEFEVYGTYTEDPVVPKELTNPSVLKNLFGVCVYEWNLIAGADSGRNTFVAPSKKYIYQGLGCIRHYLDWDRIEVTAGTYKLQPEGSGGWFLDEFYKSFYEDNIKIISCIQSLPIWVRNTYPAGQTDRESSPIKYGIPKDDPQSYIEQARLAYQIASRYGSNLTINVLGTLDSEDDLPSTGTDRDAYLVRNDTGYIHRCYVWYDSTGNWQLDIHVEAVPLWTGDPINEVKLGLGYVTYIEIGNENNRGWHGRRAYQTGRELAANLSAAYDGHKGKMGPGVGIKNICPSIKVSTCGTAGIDTKYFQGIIDWSKQYRGYRPDGSIDVPFEAINFHTYRNDGSNEQYEGPRSRGACPEVTNYFTQVSEITKLVKEYFGGSIELILGETGYDHNQQSVQKAIPIGSKSIQQVQADWILRTTLESARANINYITVYQAYDDSGGSTMYQSSGVANAVMGVSNEVVGVTTSATTYTGSLEHIPVYRYTPVQFTVGGVTYTVNPTSLTDGTIGTNGENGTFNYPTGEFTLILPSSPEVGLDITCTYRKDPTKRDTLFYMTQLSTFMGDFMFAENIVMNPALRVDKWSLDNEDVYAIWSPTENDSSGVYNLDILDPHTDAVICTPAIGTDIPNITTLSISGTYEIPYSETPVFAKITKA